MRTVGGFEFIGGVTQRVLIDNMKDGGHDDSSG